MKSYSSSSRQCTPGKCDRLTDDQKLWECSCHRCKPYGGVRTHAEKTASPQKLAPYPLGHGCDISFVFACSRVNVTWFENWHHHRHRGCHSHCMHKLRAIGIPTYVRLPLEITRKRKHLFQTESRMEVLKKTGHGWRKQFCSFFLSCNMFLLMFFSCDFFHWKQFFTDNFLPRQFFA